MTLATGSNDAAINSGSPMFTPLDSLGGRGLSPQSVGVAVALNLVLLLIFVFVVHQTPLGQPPHLIDRIFSESLTVPPSLLVKSPLASGGGGGSAGVTPPSQGNPPKFAVVQLSPPQVKPVDDAKLAVDPTIDAQVHMASSPLANVGVLSSTLAGSSLGNTRGHGVGIGVDDGYGPGRDHGTGGHIYSPGGSVSAPQVLYAPEPEFSEEARKEKVSGNVLVYLQVDANGHPMNVRVLRGIGLGLDQKAIEAVSHYKFKPAMLNGKPVAVEMQVDVNFQIF
jgi:protein TonB